MSSYWGHRSSTKLWKGHSRAIATRLRRLRLTQPPSELSDGANEKSAEEDTVQSHHGVVSMKLYRQGGEKGFCVQD
jgi:hypothetical protein